MAKALATLKGLPYSFAPSILRGHHVARLEAVARDYGVDFDEVLEFLRGRRPPAGGRVPPWVFLYGAALWCLPCVRFGEAMGAASAEQEANSTRQAVALLTAARDAVGGADDGFRRLVLASLADAETKLKQNHKAEAHVVAALKITPSRGSGPPRTHADADELLLKTIAAVGVPPGRAALDFLAGAPASCAHHVKAAWDLNGCDRATAALPARAPRYALLTTPLGRRMFSEHLLHRQGDLCVEVRRALAGELRELSGARGRAERRRRLRGHEDPHGAMGDGGEGWMTDHARDVVRAAVAMVQQCVLGGWAHYDTLPDDFEAADAVADDAAAGSPGGPGGASACPLRLLATMMYTPPPEVAALRIWCTTRTADADAPVRADVEALIQRLEILRYVRCDESAPGPLNNITDQRLADFYNSNPYPVWRNVGTAGVPAFRSYREYLTVYLPAAQHGRLAWRDDVPATRRERLLVAGCGSGHQVALALHQYRETEVVGIDLSPVNLAYARAQLEAACPAGGAGRRWSVHVADLTNPLDVASLGADDGRGAGDADRRFDVIECCGVLHHCEDPQAALKTLLGALRPGGVLVLGVYAAKSCAPVRDAIRWLEERHPSVCAAGPSLAEIKRIREEVEGLPSHHPARRVLLAQLSYYSTAAFRDMLFHPRAHYFTLPQLRDLAAACGLQLLSMSFDACGSDIAARLRYSTLNPRDEAMNSWETWEAVEKTGLLNPLPWHNVILHKPAA